MTAGLDERRPDHTRPTIAFIVLAVTAAAVMTAGMTTSRPETPIAAERPPRVASASPVAPTLRPSPGSPTFPDFSMADVVTLAAAEVETAPKPRRREPRDRGAATAPTVRPGTTPTVRGGSTGGSGDGSRPRSGSGGGTSGSGASGSGGSGGSGGSTTRDSGTKDAGPGRSTTGQGKARGQKDTSSGHGASSGSTDGRTTGRR